MRKRQPLADALALSTQIVLIEAALVEKRLTLTDVAQIDTIVMSVRALEKDKIILAPPLLRRVKALTAVARRFRELQAQDQGGRG